MLYENFDYRKESWGYILQDRINDRIWGILDSHWANILEGHNAGYDELFSAHPYRKKGWFFIGEKIPEQFDISSPISVSWNLTEQCNSRCIFCCNDAGADKNYGVETKQAFRLLDSMKNWGIMRLIIGGGEPIVRRDIKEILNYAHDIGMSPALATNGILLTEDIVNLTVKFCCTLQISLDTLNRDTYYLLRGLDAMDKLKINIRMAMRQGAPVRIVTVVTGLNFDQLDEIAYFIEENNIHQWFIFRMLQSGRAVKNTAILRTVNDSEIQLKINHLFIEHPNMDIFTWGNGIVDQIAVYIESNGDIIVRDYKKGRLITLNKTNIVLLNEAWNAFDPVVKSNSFVNFIQPNRAVPTNSLN
jgi:sulfatase maturation enzyme AslB (radical SAM superfamily)